ncbi:endonuclease I family protein [Dysgonomonas macrotermitis]|uniref:Endonuclease I n=1 Tax=Dysgonomonas macrotermitis TaxID=1346286 RepID=A0A1M5GAL8_9BACT|nr:endonuclease [Dysgonomonas macrotermitis]SHG00749.1 Endonuclease I [Dysgonomonas macrotermitis]
MAKKRKKKRSKKKGGSLKKKFLLLFSVVTIVTLYFVKDIQVDYYKNQDGLTGPALKTAMHDLIRKHKYLNFDQNTTARYWWDNYFIKTDWHPDGYYWDMYSSEKHNKYVDGSKQSREHCMPRSWWGKSASYSSYDANGDLFNLFPSDYNANQAKSNLPLGEVGIARFDNGVSKVGTNTYPLGYRGQVFEPADEYKGDFARVYFYMVTCYEDYSYDWRTDGLKTMLSQGPYPGFQPWALEMLLKWHRNDPVSEKEIERNNAVYQIQENRNPFIDSPDLAEYIWGVKKEEPFKIDNQGQVLKQPTIKDLALLYFNRIVNVILSFLVK